MTAPVDVLAVMDALIALMRNGPIGVRGSAEARAAMAELMEAAEEAGDYLAEFFEEGREHRVLVALDAALARCKGGAA